MAEQYISKVAHKPGTPISSSNLNGYHNIPQRIAAVTQDKAGKNGDLCWANMVDSIYLAVFLANQITQYIE